MIPSIRLIITCARLCAFSKKPPRLAAILAIPALGGCIAPMPTTLHARGRVIDAKTRKPVTNASVMIQGHPKASALTSQDGFFDIPSQTRWHVILAPEDPSLDDNIIVNAKGYRQIMAKSSDYIRHPIALTRD